MKTKNTLKTIRMLAVAALTFGCLFSMTGCAANEQVKSELDQQRREAVERLEQINKNDIGGANYNLLSQEDKDFIIETYEIDRDTFFKVANHDNAVDKLVYCYERAKMEEYLKEHKDLTRLQYVEQCFVDIVAENEMGLTSDEDVEYWTMRKAQLLTEEERNAIDYDVISVRASVKVKQMQKDETKDVTNEINKDAK